MMCCKEYAVTIEAVTCDTEMDVTSVTNATQNFPASGGVPPWDFGSYITGFGSVAGSVTLTFRSPTLKTWRFSGGIFNASGTLVRGWQVFIFPVAPTVTMAGVPVTLVNTTINGSDFWMIDGAGLEEGMTFNTNSCVDVEVVISATAADGVGPSRTLVNVEDITP